MRRTTLSVAVALAALLGLAVAAPVGAATTGTICGQVTDYTAATAVSDGDITIRGTTEVIDTSAFAAIDATTSSTLVLLADADATTCLEITANGAGEIVDIEIAASARVCGTAELDTGTGIYSVDGVMIPAGVVSADADLAALLDVAATADAAVCLDLSLDTSSGLIVGVALDATLTACGTASLDADSATVGGLDVPLTLLDADAVAVLAIAVDAGADVCMTATASDTDLVEANLSADIDVCGSATLDASGDATVGGVVIDASLLDAGSTALLSVAASADGTACVAVDATSSGGTTSVGVTVTIEACAEITAITDGTVTLGGVTFIYDGAAAAGLEVGDTLCFTATEGPTGDPTITDPDSGVGPGTGGGDAGLLPDTAMTDDATGAPMAPALVLAAALGAVALRRRGSQPR